MSNSPEDLYDFAPETTAPPVTKLPPQPAVKPGAPVVLPYRALQEDKPRPMETEAVKDVYLPLGLLGGGIIVQVLAAIVWTHNVARSCEELALDLTVGTGVMLAAMLVAAKIRGINLGKLGVAIYKLAAISIAPAAMVQFLSPVTRFVPLGGIIGLIVEFILFFALLGALFDLDESDTWYCVWTMFFTRAGFYLLLWLIFRP